MFKSKKEIRKYIYKLREKMNKEDKKTWDEEIKKKVINNSLYKRANIIFIYVSYKEEVDTYAIIEDALKKGKKVCIPKVDKKRKIMEPYYIKSKDDLEEGYYGIMEPKSNCKKANKDDIELIISPGVAFNKQGGRIGYGGGFYDKFINSLSKRRPIIAIAYKFQLLDQLILEENDEKIDDVISNN